MAAHSATRSSPAALASSAGALVALVAVAAMMTTTVMAAPATSGELRQTTNEGAKVRAAVAAVAAAARKLVEGDRLVQALPARWPLIETVAGLALSCDGRAIAEQPAPLSRLIESSIDLPPPAC